VERGWVYKGGAGLGAGRGIRVLRRVAYNLQPSDTPNREPKSADFDQSPARNLRSIGSGPFVATLLAVRTRASQELQRLPPILGLL